MGGVSESRVEGLERKHEAAGDSHPKEMAAFLAAYGAMLRARQVDKVESDLVRQGLAHFHVSGGGHDISALLAEFMTPRDVLLPHYRDKALMIARGVSELDFLRAAVANRFSRSMGRQMSAHMAAHQLNVASIVGPVGNNALHAVGIAAALKALNNRSVALLCVGDGTTQEGEFLEAVAESVRSAVPVIFLIEDNRYSISSPTIGKTFFDLPTGRPTDFYGLPINRVSGNDPVAARSVMETVVADVRSRQAPGVIVLEVERLADHTNADDQSVYRSPDEIAAGAQRDPIERVRARLIEGGIPPAKIEQMRDQAAAAVESMRRAVLGESTVCDSGPAKSPYPADFEDRREYRGITGSDARLTMREAINRVLHHRLATNDRVYLLGQDIEDPKGDVFGVTRGLSTAFPGRVVNAPLSESTIVGTSIGRALMGQRPVAFIQFADFLPLAFNQIISELGSMFWRTNGDWLAPVILMVSCGGYKPGLGPFHAQTLEGVMAHTPGIDVFMPSSAADAAGLLNAAFESGRPTVFFYPKSALNLADGSTSDDVASMFVAPGRGRIARPGSDLTIVTYGNPVVQSMRAAEALVAADVSVEVIDLRSISPWDASLVLGSVKRTRRLLMVHEDNLTLGFGAEVLATVLEKVEGPVAARRVARGDSYVPFNFASQIETLPSFRSVLTAAAEMLEIGVDWKASESSAELVAINAVGSGPADHELLIVEFEVQPGDHIRAGDTVAVVEAAKAAVEVQSTIDGTVQTLVGQVGGRVGVGAPLLWIEPDVNASVVRQAPVAERIYDPIFSRARASRVHPRDQGASVGIVAITAAAGEQVVPNSAFAAKWGSSRAGHIEELTGIAARRRASPHQTVVTLALEAAEKALKQAKLKVSDMDLVVAATGTPDLVTPSVACRVAAALGLPDRAYQPAFDINAACSGFLYALASAHDHVRANPGSRVLVITSEIMSSVLDDDDFDTAVLFGDAATATIVADNNSGAEVMLTITRPILSGRPEVGRMISVPLRGQGAVRMRGREAFAGAVREMHRVLGKGCESAGLELSDLDVVVPHQANQRIIDALARRLGVSVHSGIRYVGNTSSSSIPLALLDALTFQRVGARVGLVAFGGGVTSAAALAQVSSRSTH